MIESLKELTQFYKDNGFPPQEAVAKAEERLREINEEAKYERAFRLDLARLQVPEGNYVNMNSSCLV